MTKQDTLIELLNSKLRYELPFIGVAYNEVTVECNVESLMPLLYELRDQNEFAFDQLMDLCAVDYLRYGEYDWETEAATESGFSRAVDPQESRAYVQDKPRFAVVYHLLSTTKNQRLRIKVFVHESNPVVPSVHEIWKAANWFEREAYDLYGILFEGHPDLRRILTDYGFIGHPFRKDFPISGHVEMRYDAQAQKVIYEPVDIEPRTLVPKVIRKDNRYLDLEGTTK
ncbi:MAG: NADH-quinone oxidoreductase subunit C [Legionellaceae bacterium]|nr:NADH-quinone oxidoreductase subunit C [Legionellaceae bacterium]